MTDCSVYAGDPRFEMYKLLKPIPACEAGAIFYYDPSDRINGSIGQGCLKLAWTSTGMCQSGLTGGSIVFHAQARLDVDWFQRISFQPCPKCGFCLEVS